MPKKNNEGSITIKDIAAMCEVSISTVSNVLNGKNKKVSDEVAKRIMDCVEKTGYKPNYLAKSLRASSTKTIGVIAEDLIVFSATPMIEGLMNRCEEQGYNVVIENMRLFGRWSDAWMHDEALFQSALQPVLVKMGTMNVDGIIYVGGHEHTVKKLMENIQIPVVMAYAIADDTKIPTYRLDDYSGGFDAFNYLFEKGHTKIGIIAGEPDNTHTINRIQGIQKAAFNAGILFNPDFIEYQHWTREGGYEGMKALAEKDISAIFCLSDAIAAGAYVYLQEAGITPGKDISVIGYDNQDISAFLSPQLTTVALPLEDIGYQAVSKLIDIIEGNADKDDTCDIRIRGNIIERESVKRIK